MASGEATLLFGAFPDQATPERVGGGRARLRCAERGQIEWRPFSLDQLVAEDHPVRLVWAFVMGLDLTPLLVRIKAVEGHAGHPMADPRILMALWLYATVKRVGSARELARLCEEHIAFCWLCGGVSMNAKTLGDFRVDHTDVLEQLLVDSFTALVRAGVASLDRVAQDGMRVRAAAGAASFRRHATLEECRRAAEQAIAELNRQREADPAAASRQQAAARQRAAEERAQRVRAALAVAAELQAQQQEQARLQAERAARKAEQEVPDPARGETPPGAAKAPQGKTKKAAKPNQPAEPRASTTDPAARIIAHHEDGRWRLPASLQRAVRCRHRQRCHRRRLGRQQRLRHGQAGADE
jgi:transposase